MGEKMQASGGDGAARGDGVKAPKGEDIGGAGESGGGAYPNPHDGGGKPDDGFMGHGGQSEIAYHGPGQLGEDKVDDRDNSAATRNG